MVWYVLAFAVDNARLLAQANYGHCAVHKSKLLMYFIILDGNVKVMIQVEENSNLKCLAVEDCLAGHYRAWADYVCEFTMVWLNHYRAWADYVPGGALQSECAGIGPGMGRARCYNQTFSCISSIHYFFQAAQNL